MLPGINTGPIDFAAIEPMRLEKFNGRTWELFGPLLTDVVTSG
jgi:hypothetical protein